MVRVSYVLAVALAACHAGGASPSTAPPSPARARASDGVPTADVLSFLPGNSDLVIGVDMTVVRASALWAEYLPRVLAAAGPELTELTQNCGFDPIMTLESLVIGVRSQDLGNSLVIVVRGFDRDLMTRCLVSQAFRDSRITLDGDVLTSDSPSGDRTLATFADRRTLVMLNWHGATKQQLAEVVARGAPLRKSPSVVAMLDTLPRKPAVWFVATGQFSPFEQLAADIRPIAAVGTLDAPDGLAFQGQVRYAAPDQARQLASLLAPMAAKGRSLADEISVRASGNVVLLALAISRPKLVALMGHLASEGAIKVRRIGADSSDPAGGDHDGDGDQGAGEDRD